MIVIHNLPECAGSSMSYLFADNSKHLKSMNKSKDIVFNLIFAVILIDLHLEFTLHIASGNHLMASKYNTLNLFVSQQYFGMDRCSGVSI